jgi:hypothetical protein
MLKSMTFKGHGGETDPNYIYHIIDSSFTEMLRVPTEQYQKIATISYEVLLVQAYEKRRMPVATNLALFYLNFFKNRRGVGTTAETDLETWRKAIDIHYPELQYSNKYYPCMRRQLKKFSYGAI